jgi:hypothetical protein
MLDHLLEGLEMLLETIKWEINNEPNFLCMLFHIGHAEALTGK